MSTDDTNIDTPTPGVESEDTITVTVDVPVDVLHALDNVDLAGGA